MTSGTGGVLGLFLLDPSSPLTAATDFAVHDWETVLASGLPVVGAAAAGRVLWYRAGQRRLARQGHSLEILVPASVDPAGAHALWAHLRGLLRPWWRRLAGQQPHLAFEYRFAAAGLSLRLWAPGAVPLRLLQRAVEAAWPGAHTRPLRSIADKPVGEAQVATGGRLRLARPDIWPIEYHHDTDPYVPCSAPARTSTTANR
jgi:hypothetical protein